jgi:hypothetical protein
VGPLLARALADLARPVAEATKPSAPALSGSARRLQFVMVLQTRLAHVPARSSPEPVKSDETICYADWMSACRVGSLIQPKWHVKRAHHRDWPQPTGPPIATILRI